MDESPWLGDDADELIEVNADVLESQSSLKKRIREAPPPYVLRERYVGQRLRTRWKWSMKALSPAEGKRWRG